MLLPVVGNVKILAKAAFRLPSQRFVFLLLFYYIFWAGQGPT